MTLQQFERRQERAETETLVIAEVEEGFRVYSPAYPSKVYTVSGSPEAPTCTCPDFQANKSDPSWRCKHILTVLSKVGEQNGDEPTDRYDDEERRAIQAESSPEPKKERRSSKNDAAEMLIKRSVSPDGRIDSISIEFTCPVGKIPAEEIKERAEKMISLQAEIAGSFLKKNGKSNGAPQTPAPENQEDHSVPAQMLWIGGTRSKWGGIRLFMTFDVGGRNLRLYGSRKEIAQCIVNAGFPDLSEQIEEGKRLNLPCRVITKPSDDGKYTNVDTVLPIEALRFTRKPAQ